MSSSQLLLSSPHPPILPPLHSQIGQYIQSRGGVVAAEELAPMLEGQVGNTTSIAVDESYVLPVLTRFGGSPVVGQDGEILYHFPNLQQTATVRGTGEHM